MTRLDLFDYKLPEELIAQYPAERRDGSRLLVIDRARQTLDDRFFIDLSEYLVAGDVLVLNDSRVIPARLLGKKQDTGAKIELFLLKQVADTWEVLARPARRLKPGSRVIFGDILGATVLEKLDDGALRVCFEHKGPFLETLRQVGHVPLPPYIHRNDELLDTERYQTVYAEQPGSAAAPTAGLHFTKELLASLSGKGVQIQRVTLHVGLGTFRPVQSDEIEDHSMHEELYHIPAQTAAAIQAAKAEGRRVICVGTTSVRTLESAACSDPQTGLPIVTPGWGSTDIFIYPGGRGFKITDALITNFHLPKSTLLMLVAAFYEREKILSAYQHAVHERYRFFSYGDAMLLI